LDDFQKRSLIMCLCLKAKQNVEVFGKIKFLKILEQKLVFTRKGKRLPETLTDRYHSQFPGRNYVATHHRSTSGPPSNRSLTKSQGSLPGKSSGPPSVNSTSKKEIPSLTRADHSWRNKDTSLERSRSSSIPIASSAKTSPLAKTLPPAATHHTNTVFVTSSTQQHISASPLPKPKRDTLTNKVKHLDSLSRLQQQTLAASTTQLNNNNNYKFNNTKRDLNLSTNNLLSTNAGVVIRSGGVGGGTIGQGGLAADYKNKSTVPIRRGSSASMGRNSTGGGDSHQQLQQDGDNGKVRNLKTSIWNWLKI
jgi:hypothetical protein